MNGIRYLLDTNIIIGLYQQNITILDLLQIKRIKLPDAIIAATAKYYQLELLTLDKKLAGKL